MKTRILSFLVLLMVLLSGSAFAALDVAQQAAVDGISTAITDWIAVAWVIFLASVGGAASLTLAKKFIFKGL